jgi:hypothetical protein
LGVIYVVLIARLNTQMMVLSVEELDIVHLIKIEMELYVILNAGLDIKE